MHTVVLVSVALESTTFNPHKVNYEDFQVVKTLFCFLFLLLPSSSIPYLLSLSILYLPPDLV
jgi:hypothetical protein